MRASRFLIDVSLYERVGWALLHSLWQCSVLAMLLALILHLLRRASAQARYLAACVTLLAMFASLIGTVLLLEMPKTCADPAGGTSATINLRSRTMSLPGDTGPSSGPDTAVSESVVARLKMWRTLGPPALAWLWLAGVVILTLRLLGAWLRVRTLRSCRTTTTSASWSQVLIKLAHQMGITRSVGLLESSLAQVPLVIGGLRPVILLPASMLCGMPPDQIEAILAHELSHIRRHDYLVNLAQSVIEVILFYHPATRWVSAVIRNEREHCCDDVAVESCGNRLTYVKALAALEELRGKDLAIPQAATGGLLLARIRRILGKGDVSMRPSLGLSVSSLAIVILTGAALAAAAPPEDATSDPTGRAPQSKTPAFGSVSDVMGNLIQLQDALAIEVVRRLTTEAEQDNPAPESAKAGEAPTRFVESLSSDGTAPSLSRICTLVSSALNDANAEQAGSAPLNDAESRDEIGQSETVVKGFAPPLDRLFTIRRVPTENVGPEQTLSRREASRNAATSLAELVTKNFLDRRPENIRVTVELIRRNVDSPRVYPLAGVCELVHEHYKCTIFFDEQQGQKVVKRVEVIYVDTDHLRRARSDAKRAMEDEARRVAGETQKDPERHARKPGLAEQKRQLDNDLHYVIQTEMEKAAVQQRLETLVRQHKNVLTGQEVELSKEKQRFEMELRKASLEQQLSRIIRELKVLQKDLRDKADK